MELRLRAYAYGGLVSAACHSRYSTAASSGDRVWHAAAMEKLVRVGAKDAGEVLALQRAAYVTEARAPADLHLPPLRQSLPEVAAELVDPEVLALGWRNPSGRLVAAVRARFTADDRGWRRSAD